MILLICSWSIVHAIWWYNVYICIKKEKKKRELQNSLKLKIIDYCNIVYKTILKLETQIYVKCKKKHRDTKKEMQPYYMDVRLSLLLHLFKRHNLFIKIWERVARG